MDSSGFRLIASLVGVVLVALVAAKLGHRWWLWAPLGLVGAGIVGTLILVGLEMRKQSKARAADEQPGVSRVRPEEVEDRPER